MQIYIIRELEIKCVTEKHGKWANGHFTPSIQWSLGPSVKECMRKKFGQHI